MVFNALKQKLSYKLDPMKTDPMKKIVLYLTCLEDAYATEF